jgi:hypothetical protein
MGDPRDVKDVERKCRNCRCKFMARSADVRRGWAKFCSKSCKAREQTRRTGYAGPGDQPHPYSGDAVRGSFLGFEGDLRPGVKED